MFSPDGENLRALHVVLAAAVVGYLVFCLSHAYAVWLKRQQASTSGTRQWPWGVTAFLGLGLVGAAWVDQSLLERREGVIAGEGFHVVRARADASAVELADRDDVRAGDVMATFRGPVITEQLRAKESEIVSLEANLRSVALGVVQADPALTQARADARAEWQTFSAALGVLAYADGAAHPGTAMSALIAARDEAESRVKRLETLQTDGLAAAQDVEAARSRAVAAREALELSARGQDLASRSLRRVSQIESALAADTRRGEDVRRADMAALRSRLDQARADLAALRAQTSVRAPFDGRIVFRHRAPGLAQAAEPVLALATGAGFLAHVDVPADDVRYLHAGQRLELRLRDALVTTTLAGRYVSASVSPQDVRRALVAIACDLPFEQFEQLSRKAIQVRLAWTPPLYTARLTWAGIALLAASGVMFGLSRRRRPVTQHAVSTVSTVSTSTTKAASDNVPRERAPEVRAFHGGGLRESGLREGGRHTARPTAVPTVVAPTGASMPPARQMYQLGQTLRDELTRGQARAETLASIESLLKRDPVQLTRPLIEGFRVAGAYWRLDTLPLHEGGAAVTARLKRILYVVAPTSEDTAPIGLPKPYAIAR